MRVSLLKISVFFSVCYCQISCQKLIEINPPKNELVATNVFNSNEKATAAVTVIYAQMVDRDQISYRIPWMTGLSGDELVNHGNNSEYVQLYQNTLHANHNLIRTNIWTPFYNYIYEANAIIEGLSKSTKVSRPVKQQLLGEAKFIRAFSHFYLANFFGDIPFISSTDYSSNQASYRMPVLSVYQNIINDLLEAQSLLNQEYVDGTSMNSSSERIRPSKAVATALLARAYLYAEDYLNAEIQSTSIINDNRFSVSEDIDSAFDKDSKEVIFSLPPLKLMMTNEANGFVLSSPPSSINALKNSELSQNLIQAFEPNDRRKLEWLNAYSKYAFPFKYKYEAQSEGISEYSIVFRLPEQYLIRAEARAQQGKLIGNNSAESDLTTIRERANLEPKNVSSIELALTAILEERRVELFSEWGHRWFDLRRYGKIDEVMSMVSADKGSVWSENQALYPIPQIEIDNAPNISQNRGY